MPRTRRWLLALALVAGAAQAQLNAPDPDWREADAPPPPALRTDHLVKIEIPQSTLSFGVDPASVTLGHDGVVRYVVVATSSSGALNAFYEGIRCSTAEVRVYARYSPGSGWVAVKEVAWRSLHETRPSHHSLAIARNGACVGGAPNSSTQQIVRDLGGGSGNGNWRFWNN